MLIARLANHRNPHIAILALALLDTLVQSCGYPFHLQISTKEFLNELVRRFPERPPPFPGPVMSRILDLIHTQEEYAKLKQEVRSSTCVINVMKETKCAGCKVLEGYVGRRRADKASRGAQEEARGRGREDS